MGNNKELIEAAKMIRDYCRGRNCNGCIFYDIEHCCTFDDDPCDWEVENIERSESNG